TTPPDRGPSSAARPGNRPGPWPTSLKVPAVAGGWSPPARSRTFPRRGSSMSRSARHQGPLTPRWVRGLLTGALMAFFSTNFVGCGLDYAFRHISPLHPTGWSFAWPILPSQQARLERDMAREDEDKVPILDPIPGEFAPASCLDPPSEAEVWEKVPKFKTGSPVFYETQRNNVRILVEKISDK